MWQTPGSPANNCRKNRAAEVAAHCTRETDFGVLSTAMLTTCENKKNQHFSEKYNRSQNLNNI